MLLRRFIDLIEIEKKLKKEENDKKEALLLIATQKKQAELVQAETERIRLETEQHQQMLEIAKKEAERMTKLTLEKVEKEKKEKEIERGK